MLSYNYGYTLTFGSLVRQVLINYAECLAIAKRGSNAFRVTPPELAGHNDRAIDDLIFINNLLKTPAVKNECHYHLLECRVFGGMTIEKRAP